MIHSDKGHDASQLTFQRGFNRVGLALPSSHTTHVGRIDVKLARYPTVEATDQRREICRSYTASAFFTTHEPP